MNYKHWGGIVIAILITLAVVKFAKSKNATIDQYL